jgi:hypothetical protein
MLAPEPEFHLFMQIRFPVNDNSFPYKLLRTGVDR